MRKFIVEPVIRSDKAGDGSFGANRGRRVHTGVDFVCTPNRDVYSPVDGRITKLGYPYGDDLSWRYVEVMDEEDYRHRLFYVKPADVAVGDWVDAGDVIGLAQDISKRYPSQEKPMTPHVHYEIMDEEGVFVDPEAFHA